MSEQRAAILVTSYPGDATVDELERAAAEGRRPRKDYVELAKLLDAEVVDIHHLEQRAVPAARAAARAGVWAGQVVEAFVRRRRLGPIIAWSDKLGLVLAFLFKLTRSRRDLVMISVLLSDPEKRVFLRPLGVHSHLAAIINYGSSQMEIAATRLGVPRAKLHLLLQPVDERFFRPDLARPENLVVAVGMEARDYPTLLRAADGLAVDVEIAAGTTAAPDFGRGMESVDDPLPANVRLHSGLRPHEVRDLYARARAVVIPLHDVDYDAGVTTITEAMAMGKPVIVTRTRGQVDLIEEGEQGTYVPPGDAAALRAAIERVLGDPEAAERMGRAGRALVERQHTLDSYVARIAEIVRATR